MNDTTNSRESAETALRYLYPKKRHPYYIVTPRYIQTSAGIKALHLLCHTLNASGHNAFLWFQPRPILRALSVNPDLLTPILTRSIMEEHYREGRTPIVVYPETVSGNPLKAPLVVRYVLNYAGLLGGDAAFDPSEYGIAYSAKLAQSAGVPTDRVLFVPASDTNVFHPGDGQQPRQGSCFYAAKYRDVHKAEPFDITKDSVEITREKPDSQTPDQIAELFRRSEVFYTYENTALAIEAILCNCPTVFLPNPWLTEVIAADELGWDGYAWGADPAEVQRARDTVGRARQNYLRTYDRFWEQLERFAATTQKLAAKTPYPVELDLALSWRESVEKFRLTFRQPLRFVRWFGYAALLYLAWEMFAR